MRSNPFLALVSIFFVACAWGEVPLDIGGNKQLFIDSRFIAASDNIALTMNPAQKLGKIRMADDLPIYGHTSRVIEDQGKIRLYVGADRVAALESDDGIHFRRTDIVVSKGIFTTIFLDEHDPDPARRYKVFWVVFNQPFRPESDGVYGAYSPDGVNFTDVGRVLPFFIDNPAIVLWEPRIEKYLIYTRAFNYDGENQRQIGRIETDDVLKPWPYIEREERRERLSIHDVPVVLAADEYDDPHSDIYYNAATLYPWAQDVYLMFTAQFRHFDANRQPFIRPPQGNWEDFGLLEVQVAASRDGIKWRRPSREAYFPTGLADEWDRWYAVMAPGIVRRGSYLYQYYVSSGRTHDSAVLRAEYDDVATTGGIGVVRQRLDGFVSADADHHGGWIETPPVVFAGNRLRLNVDTGAMGRAFVELRELDGTPIPGYTLEACEEIGGNFIDQTIYWKGNFDVSGLQGRPLRLYFSITRGKLFAFQFTSE